MPFFYRIHVYVDMFDPSHILMGNFTGPQDKSTLVQVMAWCYQPTSHYLNKCWSRFWFMTSLCQNELIVQRSCCFRIWVVVSKLRFRPKHDAIKTSLLRQNDVATSFWRSNDIIIAPRIRWVTTTANEIHSTLWTLWDSVWTISFREY